MNIFLLVAAINFSLQVVCGIISIVLGTEFFFDFVGSITFVLCAITSYIHVEGSSVEEFQMIQAVCICLWAGKLGIFLLSRVIKSGGDKRFIEIKKSKSRFFKVWLVQGIWVYLNMLPSLFVFSATKMNPDLIVLSLVGWVIYAFGLIFETVADFQKTVFRNKSENENRFITSGLWSLSRHPNYFGEILLWYGLFIASIPFLSSPVAMLSVLCPTLTALQIIYYSGVPLLEVPSLKKWGDDPKYIEYIKTTSCIIPCLGVSDYKKSV